MNRSRRNWWLIVFGLVLLMAGFSTWSYPSWAQTVPPTTTPTPTLPAVHPLYGNCNTSENGTIPPPVFEPFLPNSIYVDWCGHALLTLAPQNNVTASQLTQNPVFDPTIGHRIGLFYTTDITETGWFIAQYSYRVDFTNFADLNERSVTLLRELCPLGNICNEILLAKIGKLGATFSVLDAAGEHPLDRPNNKIFVPYASNRK